MTSTHLLRPVLLVPGGISQQDGLAPLWHYLTDAGANRYAGSWDVSQRDEFSRGNPQANVYGLHYSKTFNTFENNAAEVQMAIDDIKRRTGAADVDVVAECKGAEEVRELIYQGGHGIHNLLLLTPMNHGLPVAGAVTKMVADTLRALHLPMPHINIPYIKDILSGSDEPDTLKALDEMAGDCENPVLAALNTPENLAHERQAVHTITVLGGDVHMLGAPFGVGLPVPALSGDGAVTVAGAFMPTAENFFFPVQHALEFDDPDYLAKVAETLVSDGRPQHDSHFYARSADVPTKLKEVHRVAAQADGAAKELAKES